MRRTGTHVKCIAKVVDEEWRRCGLRKKTRRDKSTSYNGRNIFSRATLVLASAPFKRFRLKAVKRKNVKALETASSCTPLPAANEARAMQRNDHRLVYVGLYCDVRLGSQPAVENLRARNK